MSRFLTSWRCSRVTGHPKVIRARNRLRSSEKACLLSNNDTSTHLPCEVTAYDWSCSQRTILLAFFEKWLDGCLRSRVVELRTFCIMLRNGIAQFVGSWVSESGYHLRIKKVNKGRASVDFFDPRAAPVQRSYMGGVALTEDGRALRLERHFRSGFVAGGQRVHFGFDSRARLRAGSGATRSARASPQPK